MKKLGKVPAASFLLFFALLPPVAAAQEEAGATSSEEHPRFRFEVTKATSPIVIDGRLEDAGWANAARIPLPFEWFPAYNVPAVVATQAWVTYDDDNLYLALVATDPDPKAIRAHFALRDDVDSLIQDDHAIFLLDPFDDGRRALQFRVNPLGVQVDGTLTDLGVGEEFAWDAIWSAAAQIDDQGWRVEVAIPFTSLRFPRGTSPSTWGFLAERSYPREVRHRLISRYTDLDRGCYVCQMNALTGIGGIEGSNNFELAPELTASRSEIRTAPGGGLDQSDDQLDLGGTVRWTGWSNLTFLGTVNPDFSQVEADVAQLTVNERFALFFPEKRPFFTEGAEYFSTPLQAVFSRTLIDPKWGVKVTGKDKANAIGAFFAEDDRNLILIPGSESSQTASLEGRVRSAVLRYRRDIGKTSALGFLATKRSGDAYSNEVVGADGYLQIRDGDSVSFQALRSNTDYPNAVALSSGQDPDEFSGNAFFLNYHHASKDWITDVGYRDLDEEFRADAGFLPRVGIKALTWFVDRRFEGTSKDWYSLAVLGAGGERVETHDGDLADQKAALYAYFSGSDQRFGAAEVNALKTNFRGVTYDQVRGKVYYEIQPSGALRLGASAEAGDTVDFDNGRAAKVLLLVPQIDLKIGPKFITKGSYTFERLRVDQGRLFDAKLAQVRIWYHFDVRTSVRLIVQDQTVDRDPSLYLSPVPKKSETLLGQLLFTYRVNPRTEILVGASENRSRQGRGLEPDDRTYYLKLGYSFSL